MLVAVSITETLLSDFIRDALEGARTRRACSLVRSSLPPGRKRKLRAVRTAEDRWPFRGRECKPSRRRAARPARERQQDVSGALSVREAMVLL